MNGIALTMALARPHGASISSAYPEPRTVTSPAGTPSIKTG